MNQTPLTEKHKRAPRLYVEAALSMGADVPLPEAQAHYLKNVMRLGAGDRVRVFNGRDGEWLAALAVAGKKSVSLSVAGKIAEQAPAADVWALASPVKKEAFELMLEKSTELGAARFVPVLCDHTVVRRLNEERARAIAVEAAEQSERLDVPAVEPLRDLKDVLKNWDPGRALVFCLERDAAPPVADAVRDLRGRPLAVLVGPEGGFSPDEIAFLKGLPFVRPVSLGPGILRAETALIAALACIRLC